MVDAVLTSEFPLSAHQSRTDAFRDILAAVHWGFDPIASWAQANERSDAQMAMILGCPLEVYKQHCKNYDRQKMRSPLTGQQVLDFCYQSGIHPTDLTTETFDPRDACATHVYEALVLLYQRRDAFRDDHEYAVVGLLREQSRYKRFVEDYPDIAEYHREIETHAALLNPEPVRDNIVQGNIIAIKSKTLRLALLPAFGRASIASLGSAAALFHAEDYQQARHARLQSDQIEISRMRETMVQSRIALRVLIANHYGAGQVENVMGALSAKLAGLRYIGRLSDQRIVHVLQAALHSGFKSGDAAQDPSVQHRYAAGYHTAQIADAFYNYAVQEEDISHKAEMLAGKRRAVLGYDLWLSQAEQVPHDAYTMRLYLNNSIAPVLNTKLRRRSVNISSEAAPEIIPQGMQPE